MNIYFYDIFSSSYNRFGNRISECLVQKNPSLKIFYIHDNYDHGVVNLGKTLAKNVFIIKKSKIKVTLKKYFPDVFVSFSFRIPDVYWTHFFNKIGVKTVQVQHGLYVEKYKRNVGFVLHEKSRFISYCFYLVKLIVSVKKKSGVVPMLTKKDIKITQKSNDVEKNLLSNVLIIWGAFWKDWFRQHFLYNESTKYVICGSFDFDILNKPEKLLYPPRQSVCYICQTLIEDGRLDRTHFDIFLQKLFEFAQTYNGILYIKLHPRSDKRLYSRYSSCPNVIFTDKFPISDVFIGHYSSLLSLSAYLKKKILIVHFPGHIGFEAFKHMEENVINYDENINISSFHALSLNTNYYYEYNKTPFMTVAETILREATF